MARQASEQEEFARLTRAVPGWEQIVAEELRKLGYTVTAPQPPEPALGEAARRRQRIVANELTSRAPGRGR